MTRSLLVLGALIVSAVLLWWGGGEERPAGGAPEGSPPSAPDRRARSEVTAPPIDDGRTRPQLRPRVETPEAPEAALAADVEEEGTNAPMNGRALARFDPVAMKSIQSGIDAEVRPALRDCLVQAWGDHEPPVLRRVSVVAILDIASHDEVARIRDVEVPEWPEDVDPELRSCIEDAFHDAELSTDPFAFEYRLEYPLTFSLPDAP